MFNHSNLDVPDGGVGDSTFAQIRGAVGGPLPLGTIAAAKPNRNRGDRIHRRPKDQDQRERRKDASFHADRPPQDAHPDTGLPESPSSTGTPDDPAAYYGKGGFAMFCDRCGTPLASRAQFCTSCGKPVAPGALPPASPVTAPLAPGRVRKHIHLLAILWLVNAVLRLTGVAWLMFFGSAFLPWLRGRIGADAWPLGPGWGLDSFLSSGFFSLGIFLGLFGLLHLALAWGLFERQSWARILGLVLGILALLRFPFGTALGIYTLWVLAPEASAREYDQLSPSGGEIQAAGYRATPR